MPIKIGLDEREIFFFLILFLEVMKEIDNLNLEGKKKKKRKRDFTVWNNARQELQVIFITIPCALPARFTFANKTKRLPHICLTFPFSTLYIIAYIVCKNNIKPIIYIYI